ncbi:DUF6520 family protein [Flavobacterium sp. CGRL2]
MKKVILPALVIVLAVTSAFTTEATSKKKCVDSEWISSPQLRRNGL